MSDVEDDFMCEDEDYDLVRNKFLANRPLRETKFLLEKFEI